MSKTIYTKNEILCKLQEAVDDTERDDYTDLWELRALTDNLTKAISEVSGMETCRCILTEEDSGIYDGISDESCPDEYIMYDDYTSPAILVYNEDTEEVERRTVHIKAYYGNNTFLGEDVDIDLY